MYLPIDLSKVTYINKVQKYEASQPIALLFASSWAPICRGVFYQLSCYLKQYPDVYYLVIVQDIEKQCMELLLNDTKFQLKVLDVVCDSKQYDSLIEQFNITTLPHLVLLKYQGKVLYSGHPCDKTLIPHLEKAIEYQKPENSDDK